VVAEVVAGAGVVVVVAVMMAAMVTVVTLLMKSASSAKVSFQIKDKEQKLIISKNSVIYHGCLHLDLDLPAGLLLFVGAADHLSLHLFFV
jgi:hypothetical protein